jgi:hypothetical protein
VAVQAQALPNMASAEIQQPQGHSTTFEPLQAKTESVSSGPTSKAHNVSTTLNYYKDPGDGSEPPATYVGKPETYERPYEPLDVVVQDVRGQEDQYTLDKNGFQIYRHKSVEKDFLDDELIKAVYYPETEQLLKDAYGPSISLFIPVAPTTYSGPWTALAHRASSSSTTPSAAPPKTPALLPPPASAAP